MFPWTWIITLDSFFFFKCDLIGLKLFIIACGLVLVWRQFILSNFDVASLHFLHIKSIQILMAIDTKHRLRVTISFHHFKTILGIILPFKIYPLVHSNYSLIVRPNNSENETVFRSLQASSSSRQKILNNG